MKVISVLVVAVFITVYVQRKLGEFFLIIIQW